MSIVGSEQWMYSAGREFYDFPIEQSLRFEDGDSAYLSRTPATAGNRKTWTFSAWIKLGSLSQGERGTIFSSSGGPTIYQDSGLRFAHAWDPAGTDYVRETVGLFRDTSAWYHVVWWCDTTQAGTRWKIYVNGTEQTLQTPSGNNGEPAQNTDLGINSTNSHTIGVFAGTYFDGYMAEVNFIDGQALDPTSFGETKSGIWIPKDTAGLTFGTNGFRLQFGDSAAIGDDTSGNTNDWTVNNLVASDSVLDAPTNNFATWNTLDRYNYNAPSEGNLRALTAGNNGTQAATFAVSSGKWYWEVRNGTAGSGTLARLVGIGKEETNLATIPYNNADNYMYYSFNGNSYTGGTQTAYGDSWQADGDTIGVAFDADNGAIWFSKNGTWQNSATAAEIAAGTTTNAAFTGLSGTFVPIVSKTGGTSSNDPHHANFGQDSTFAGAKAAGGNADENGYGDFAYAPPSGFLSLCSANLPTGAIDTLADETPEDYFNTVLWTGDDANPRSLTGIGFQPDFVWTKQRSSNGGGFTSHQLYDNVRGTQKLLRSNTTDAELANPSNGGIQSFDADGFTIQGSSASVNMNDNTETYAAWNWKAGGTGVSNTDGSITSTVSVGATSQQNWFSIVSYTGDGTVASGSNVGHGLGRTPDAIIVKDRDAAVNWNAWFNSFTGSQVIYPNLTNARNSDANVWSATVPTSSVFYVGNGEVNASSNNYIAYCFANAENLCKAGSYVGNSSADGTFVFTGFRVAYLLAKSTSGATQWMIYDNTREGYNVDNDALTADDSAVEKTDDDVDFLSNGFKWRRSSPNFNQSGVSYIYLALASQPFSFANAR